MDEDFDRFSHSPSPLRCSHLSASADGRSVVLSYRHDDRQRLARIQVDEDAHEVRVTVWVEWRPDTTEIAGATHVTRRTLRLPNPLAGRRLVDGAERWRPEQAESLAMSEE